MSRTIAYNMDCMEGMKQYPDKYFDLAVVDPPYGINAPNMGATPCQRRYGNKRLNSGGGKLKHRILNQTNVTWDNAIPSDEYFDELTRVAHTLIIWGGNYFDLPPSRCIIVWDKVQPWENFSQVEIAWTSMDKPAQIYKFDNRTGDKIHPTQKPVELYSWIYHKYLPEGGKVIDTHLGSGSNRIAAHKAGNIDFVGYEIDKDYFEAQEKRFKLVTSQLTLL